MHTGTGLASAWSEAVDDRGFRLLVRAALCSLVLHLLILWFLPYFKEFRQSRAALPPLTAHLATPKPAPPEPPKAEPPPAPRTPLLRPAARPQQRPVAAPPAPPVPAPVLSMEPSKPSAEPALSVPAAPAQPVARAEPAPVAAGPDPGTVARFRLELMEIARRYKRYPRIAQDNNWEGRVELRIAFAESGAISSMTVKKGTGRAVLDEEAQSMIRSAQPQASIPPALRGKAFVLEIPVDFFLRDER